MEGDRHIFSKRYPLPPEIEELIIQPQSKEEMEGAEKSLQEFWRRITEESVFVPMPERLKECRRFIELAKDLSQRYEIDMDIWEKSYFIKVDLHLRHCSFPGPFTRRFAELFNMCDKFSSSMYPGEPNGFTLSLEFYTHKYYLSGRLVNDRRKQRRLLF